MDDSPGLKYEIRQSDNGEPTDLIPDTNPIDIPNDALVKEIFYALKYSMGELECWNCLILVQSPGEGSICRRLGIAEVKSSWFFDCPKQHLVLT